MAIHTSDQDGFSSKVLTAFQIVIILLLPLFSFHFLMPEIERTGMEDHGRYHSQNSTRAGTGLLLTEVYPDPLRPEQGEYLPDEFVTITNTGDSPCSIAGWRLTDSEGELTFPAGSVISSGGSIHVTGNGSAFLLDQGFRADYEWNDEDAITPDVAMTGNFWLANNADDLILKTNTGTVADSMAWGENSVTLQGWTGHPVPKPSEGELLFRNRNESSGDIVDSDTKEDWMHFRKHWLGQSDFGIEKFSVSGPVMPFVSPDTSFQTLANEIDGADMSIEIELYQFTNWHLAQYLFAAAERGVAVRLLLEGGPVGWHMETWGEQNPEVNQEKYIVRELVSRGAAVRFMNTDGDNYINDRYSYIHAKYAVFDGRRTIVMTENWKESGVPTDPTYGNRGWGIVVEDTSLASYVRDVFNSDWNDSHPDIFLYSPSHDRYGDPVNGFVLNESTIGGNYRPHFHPIEINGPLNITPIISPDTSLLSESGIIKMLYEAKETVLAELFYFDTGWDQNGLNGPNPYLEALMDAARRGCRVKILLDSSDYDQDQVPDNKPSMEYLRELADVEDLDIETRLFDTAMTNLAKHHNKGLIVDSRYVLVSSINWNINSITNNRELALIIESEAVSAFFYDVFMSDWENNDPISVPGEDVSILPGETVTFNGSASWDPDGDPLTHAWSYPGGINEYNVSSERRFDHAGIYTVGLSVQDGRGGEDSDVLNVTVNTPPVAKISIDGPAIIGHGQVLNLDGNSSYDADGDRLSFNWSFGDDSENRHDEYTSHIFNDSGRYTVVLEVFDGIARDNDTVEIEVILSANRPPVVLITSPKEGAEYHWNESITFDASGSRDPDGDALSFLWGSNVSGELGRESVLNLSLDPGKHRIMLQVEDTGGHLITTIRNITVIGNGSSGYDVNGSDEGTSVRPRVTITEPMNGTVVSGITIIEGGVEGRFVVDRDSLDIRFNEGKWSDVSDTGPVWSFHWNTSEFSNGNYFIAVRARVNGTWSRNASVIVVVENTIDGPGDDDPENEGEENKSTEDDMRLWVWIAIAMFVVIIIVLSVMFYIRKEKKEEGIPEPVICEWDEES